MACALVLLETGCASITGDLSAPVAVELVTSHAPTDTIEEFDTVVVPVRVRNRAGDTIAGAPRQLVSYAPDTVAVDSAISALIGKRPGSAKVLAISGTLRSNLLAVVVVRAPDSLALVGSSRDTVLASDSASAPLAVRLLDLRTDTTQALGLAGYQVTFAITLPVVADTSVATAVLGNRALSAVVRTGSGTARGTASVIVKRRGAPPQPDSVVVQASATRANGAVVRGSPVRFVVRFQ